LYLFQNHRFRRFFEHRRQRSVFDAISLALALDSRFFVRNFIPSIDFFDAS
jgi:hypothetical protein